MAKLNSKYKFIIAFILISLSLGGLLMLIDVKNDQISFSLTNTTFPKSTPSKPTSFISHPQIISTQQSLEQIQSDLNQLEIDHHPLLPPNLDMDVNL